MRSGPKKRQPQGYGVRVTVTLTASRMPPLIHQMPTLLLTGDHERDREATDAYFAQVRRLVDGGHAALYEPPANANAGEAGDAETRAQQGDA